MNPPRPVDVFLLAQNRLLREALSRLLCKRGGIHVVGSSAFEADVLDAIRVARPEILLFDSMSLGLSGPGFVGLVHKDLPAVKVLMIGMPADRDTFLRSVRDGAVGYVLENASALEIVLAIRSVSNHEAVCPPKLCALLFEQIARQSSQMPSFHIKRELGLTSRQQQLVQMIGRGLTNKEIASQLNLAEQTVRNHVHRMLRKLGATDRLQVADLCRSEGMVT
jgi:two-component system, NarL family, response regulator DevR